MHRIIAISVLNILSKLPFASGLCSPRAQSDYSVYCVMGEMGDSTCTRLGGIEGESGKINDVIHCCGTSPPERNVIFFGGDVQVRFRSRSISICFFFTLFRCY